MLSVVLYGRNDNHGYNLHKRGAISLNAIAHLLRDPDDELIFVDYNTPDDLPTFPEAIADTLTKQARKVLRILRVRPSQHARFTGETHLNALEPIARNVAVRRSNPANRWVLSTNTDMIFTPRDPAASLGSMVGALPDGFYHLPRFELPEALWEGLDRKDAPGIIDAVGEWGLRFHLDEVVRSGSDNLFDGPGDFQLFLREDLFAIGGFDEAMLKGWHVDANVARRMRILRGVVTSAETLLRGYHCDHTRQASPYHKGDRVENDPVRFVDEVTEAAIASQIETFGLGDEPVEEVKLGAGTSARYLAGLASAVPSPAAGPLESAYVTEAFGRMDYPLDHVLPYVLDLVSCLPADARIGYLGGRLDTLEALQTGWKAMGGVHPLRAPAPADGSDAAEAVEGALADWVEACDLFIFEIGGDGAGASADLTDEQRRRLRFVRRGMDLAFAVDAPRQRTGAHPRRAIVINAINNSFEATLFRHLAITLTPFSSRTRHGFIVDPEAAWATASGPRRSAAAALGRALPILPAEVRACTEAFAASHEAGAPVADARRLAGMITALVEAGEPRFPPASDPIAATLRTLSPAARAGGLPATSRPVAGLLPHGRVIRLEDWGDPDFQRMAYALFPNRRHDDPAERSAWTWERVSLALNLNRSNALARGPRVLVAAELPELLGYMLSSLGAEVDTVDPRTLASGRLQSADWRPALEAVIPSSAPHLGRIEARRSEIDAGFRYDAVLLPQNALFAGGRDGAADLLQAVLGLLKPGGHLGLAPLTLAADVDPIHFGDNLTTELVKSGGWAALMSASTAFQHDGEADGGLSPGALDTLPGDGDASASVPSLLMRDGPALRAPAVFSFTVGEAPQDAAAGWTVVDRALRTGVLETGVPEAGVPATATHGEAALSSQELSTLVRLAAEVLAAPAPGSVLRRLQAGPATVRTPLSVRTDPGGGRQLMVQGPIGRLRPGPYDLRIQATVAAGSEAVCLVLDRERVAARLSLPTGENITQVVTFTVQGDSSAPVAVALITQPGAVVELLDVTID